MWLSKGCVEHPTWNVVPLAHRMNHLTINPGRIVTYSLSDCDRTTESCFLKLNIQIRCQECFIFAQECFAWPLPAKHSYGKVSRGVFCFTGPTLVVGVFRFGLRRSALPDLCQRNIPIPSLNKYQLGLWHFRFMATAVWIVWICLRALESGARSPKFVKLSEGPRVLERAHNIFLFFILIWLN
jgi:hypothetical protein